MGREEGSRWDELVLVTPLYSLEGVRASSSQGESLHRLGPGRNGDALTVAQQEISEFWGGGKELLPQITELQCLRDGYHWVQFLCP